MGTLQYEGSALPSWNEALRRVCMSRNSLTASKGEALETNIQGSPEGCVIWESDDGKVESIILAAYQKRIENNNRADDDPKDNHISEISWIKSKLWRSTEPTVDDEDDHFDDSLYGGGVDDDSTCTDNCPSVEIPDSSVILDVELAVDSLSAFLDVVAQYIDEEGSKIMTIDRSTSSLSFWLANNQQETNSQYTSSSSSVTLSKLPLHHQVVLVRCACKLSDRVFYKSRQSQKQPDLVAVRNDDDTAESSDVMITIYELSRAQERIQSLIDGWASRAHSIRQRAVNHQRQGRRKAGLAELRQVKLIENMIDQQYLSLENIQSALLGVESSRHRRGVTLALEAAATTLKSLNEQISTDEIDEVILDLKEEMDAEKEIQQTLYSAVDEPEFDDESLLKELDALTLEDDKQPAEMQSTSSGCEQDIPPHVEDRPQSQPQEEALCASSNECYVGFPNQELTSNPKSTHSNTKRIEQGRINWGLLKDCGGLDEYTTHSDKHGDAHWNLGRLMGTTTT